MIKTFVSVFAAILCAAIVIATWLDFRARAVRQKEIDLVLADAAAARQARDAARADVEREAKLHDAKIAADRLAEERRVELSKKAP